MFGGLALLLAAGAAFWALYRAGKGDGAKAGGQKRAIFLLKVVVWFGIAAALFAAKLLPLALMVLLAAGGVTAIEVWRDRAIKANGAGEGMIPGAGARPPANKAALALDEAAAILGVAPHASADDIRAAHKKLIGQLHPDKGGTDYLAAKINDARSVMLARIGGGPANPQ
ncbi:MAG: DnaJ domain-containing protein [Parvularculaceae bacterium]|nr:DnaJ domain-containing protein [Parvularculaceae bacterium]